MINELLIKYKDQKPKTFGEHHIEKCYPVSAVIAMLEEQKQQLRQPAVSGAVCEDEELQPIECEKHGSCKNCPHYKPVK